MKELLPIGSVVLLKEGSKRLMICGRVQKHLESGRIFDYSACYYPEGIINAKDLFLFNNQDIDMVYYVGMQDVEEFKFREFLAKQMEEQNPGK